MSYILFLLVWILAYLLPATAGEWYDVNFNIYQSSIALFLIICAIPFRKMWWIRSFCTVCLLQIWLNAYDFVAIMDVVTYNQTQLVLNVLEFTLLFFVGGSAQLRSYHEHISNHDNRLGRNGRGGHSSRVGY